MQVHEINCFKELAIQRSAWDRLWLQTSGANFFHSFDWFAAYWRHYGKSQKLRALLIGEGNDISGLVPLVVRAEATRVGRVRVLTYPLHDWGSFYGPLSAAAEVCLAAAMRHLRATPRDWDLLDLRWIDPDIDRGATHAAMRAAGFTADETRWATAAVVDTADGWPAYWKSRTSDWRNNINRCERKLAQEGKIAYRRYRSVTWGGQVDPCWDQYETCVAVAGRSWQSTATDGTTLTHQEIRDFLRDSHASAASADAVDINLLYLDDRPAAFAYNYGQRGWVYGLRTGYDACLSRSGAGTVLMARMIRDSCERGDQLFDLGAGYLDVKRYWHTRRRPIHHCTYFSPVAGKAQLLRLKRWLDRRWAGQTSTAPK